ncbi:MAG: RidA family protein [Pyrinomonadaceae bacterium]
MCEKVLINPSQLAKPRGFNHGVLVEGGHLLFLAGQDASGANGKIVAPGDIVKQYEKVIGNLQAVVEAAGGTLEDIVKLNIYVTNREDYKSHSKDIGEIHRAHFGNYYPAIALFEVKSLFQDDALIEMEGIAHLKIVNSEQ